MRPSKTDYYLNIAKEVASRGTCNRRTFGAIIVKNDQIISTGYVGAPRGSPNCIDLGVCPREKLNIPAGERYELCRSVHSEANAIVNAARAGVSVLGGVMYLFGQDIKTKEIVGSKPCKMCRRLIINAGIEKVVMKEKNGFVEHNVNDWLNEETTFTQENTRGY
jgi:dCMP deaminase